MQCFLLSQGEYEAALTIYDNHVSRAFFFFTENSLKTMVCAFFLLYETETYHSAIYVCILFTSVVTDFKGKCFSVVLGKMLKRLSCSSSVSYTCA